MSLLEQEFSTTAGTYLKGQVCITHGEGVWIYDDNGNKYFDGIAGIGANSLGHAHPKFNTALKEQIDRTVSVPELLTSDIRATYQKRLLEQFGDKYNRVFLCNGGAEANEAALKFARVSSGLTHIAATVFGYHGKTLGALSVTHNPKYREKYEPLYKPVSYLPASKGGADIEKYHDAVREHGKCSAFIFEGIQGEGGVRHQDGEFIATVASDIQANGGFVIADEVQCGAGRTGDWLGFSDIDVEPDFIVLGKGIASGVPLSAVIIHERVPSLPPLSHTTTFGGNPLSCAAGLAVLNIIEEDSLLLNVQEQGARFREILLEADLKCVREIRGKGLMIGVELKQKAGKFLAPLAEKGVLPLLAGPRVLRLLPAYTVSREEIDFVADAFVSVLSNG